MIQISPKYMYVRKPWSIIVVHFCSRELVLSPASWFCFPWVSLGLGELFLVSASYFSFPQIIFHFRDLFSISES